MLCADLLMAVPAHAGDVHVPFVVIEGHSVVSNQGERYPSWTYNGAMPGPVVRATVGDTIHVSFTNPKKNRQSQLFPDAKNYQNMIRNIGWNRSLINGRAFRYDPLHDSDSDRVLMARPGERVRIYFLNANINMPVAFHVRGGIWDRVFINGNPANVRYDMQTMQIGVAETAALDVVTPAGHASNLLFTDANADASQRGASTLLISDPDADPKYGTGANILIR